MGGLSEEEAERLERFAGAEISNAAMIQKSAPKMMQKLATTGKELAATGKDAFRSLVASAEASVAAKRVKAAPFQRQPNGEWVQTFRRDDGSVRRSSLFQVDVESGGGKLEAVQESPVEELSDERSSVMSAPPMPATSSDEDEPEQPYGRLTLEGVPRT